MRVLKPFYAVVVFALVMFALVTTQSFATSLPAEQTLKKQFKNLVYRSLVAHEAAQSAHDWFDSEHYSRKVIEQISAHKDEEGFKEAICATFSELNDREALSLFMRDLKDSNFFTSTECLVSLVSDVDQFWNHSVSNKLQQIKTLNPTGGFFQQTALAGGGYAINTAGGPYLMSGDLPRKTVAFTFDDGPHPSLTRKLLNTLDEYRVKATFFMLGQNAANNTKIVRDVARNGHTIGSHSHTHPNMRSLSSEAGKREITRSFNAIFDALDGTQTFMAPFFRFPYGNKTDSGMRLLKQNDIASFFWSIDTLDWKIKNPNRLYEKIMGDIRSQSRGIVLMHDIQSQTIAMMPLLLESLKREGYEIVVLQPTNYMYRRPF